MKKYLSVLLGSLLFLSLSSGMALGLTWETSFADTTHDWPGYTTGLGDTNGTPLVGDTTVTVVDGKLTEVAIQVANRRYGDNLFINTDYANIGVGAWDTWDYYVRDSGADTTIGDQLKDMDSGLYSVDSFNYSLVDASGARNGQPGGLDPEFSVLSNLDDTFLPDYNGSLLVYDFTGFDIRINTGFVIAYAPWCANDITIGAGEVPSVPEPATMLLLGTGLIGLATFGRKRIFK